MGLTKYTYSISHDTLNEKVNSDKLSKEIQTSPEIIVALAYIETNGDILDIWMKSNLPPDQLESLNEVVSTHDGIPNEIQPEKIIIKESEIILPLQEKAFPDFSGYPCFVKGVHGEMSAGQTSYIYLSFDSTVRIQGGGFYIGDNPEFGDYINLDMTYGEGGPVVGQFISTIYTMPNMKWERNTPDTMEIPVGVSFRVGYTSVGESPVNVSCWFALRRTPEE